MFFVDQSVLLVVDMQERLFPLIENKEQLLHSLPILIKTAQMLKIPILYTEQVPEKIGQTIPEFLNILPQGEAISKASFSCCTDHGFVKTLSALNRKQIIVTGIETQVCIYQTVSDLLKVKYDVSVIIDGVGARTPENNYIGLEEMKRLGASLKNTEMMLFELLRTSKHPQFKNFLELIKT